MHSISLRKWILKAFVIVCFIGLLLPNITLFNEKENAAIVRKENRKITAFPKIQLLKKDFYPKFEKFYQDRLFARDKLIYAWSILNYKCHVIIKGDLVVGKHGWLFSKGANVKEFKDKEIKLKKLKEIQDFCDKRGIKFAFIAPPYKNAIYADYLPRELRSTAPDYHKIENDLINECKKMKINYISLYKPLLRGRKLFHNDIYWWDDHHWSYEGASIASDVVLKYIKKYRSNFEYNGMEFDGTYKSGYKECSQAKSLGIDNENSRQAKAPWSKKFTNQIYGVDKYTSEKVVFSKEPISNNYLWGKIVKGESRVYNDRTNNNLKILFLCNSYGSYMTTYLSQFISKMVNTHYLDKAEKKKNTDLRNLIKQYQPDLVVLEISAPTFFNSKGIGIFKEIKY